MVYIISIWWELMYICYKIEHVLMFQLFGKVDEVQH